MHRDDTFTFLLNNHHPIFLPLQCTYSHSDWASLQTIWPVLTFFCSISDVLPQHLDLCTSSQGRWALLDTTHFLPFCHDSHPFSHSSSPLSKSLLGVHCGSGDFCPHPPLQPFSGWWVVPPWTRGISDSGQEISGGVMICCAAHFKVLQSAHCYCSAVNEPHGKYECWPNHLRSNHSMLLQSTLYDTVILWPKGVSCLLSV